MKHQLFKMVLEGLVCWLGWNFLAEKKNYILSGQMGSRYMTMKWFASKFQMKAVFFFSESISFKMFLKILKEQKPWNRKSSLYIFWFYSARKIRINLLSFALFIAIIQQVQKILNKNLSDLNKKLGPSQKSFTSLVKDFWDGPRSIYH